MKIEFRNILYLKKYTKINMFLLLVKKNYLFY